MSKKESGSRRFLSSLRGASGYTPVKTAGIGGDSSSDEQGARTRRERATSSAILSEQLSRDGYRLDEISDDEDMDLILPVGVSGGGYSYAAPTSWLSRLLRVCCCSCTCCRCCSCCRDGG